MMDHILDKNTLSIVMDYRAQLTHSEKFTSVLVDITDPYNVWILWTAGHTRWGTLFHCPCGSGLRPTFKADTLIGDRTCERHDDDNVARGNKIVANHPRVFLYLRHV